MAASALTEAQEAEFGKALAWLQSHLLNHAERTFAELRRAVPDEPRVQRLHGIALYKLGRREEGIAAIAAGAEADGGNPRAWADLAVALRDNGQADAARTAYALALAAQTPGMAAPALDGVVFCTEAARHDFKIVDYDYRAEIRYGAGRPAHKALLDLIGQGRKRYRDFLTGLGEIQTDFAKIQLGGDYEQRPPFWLNAWFPPLDGMALTGMLRAHNPARFLEVGSGVSTKFARRAVELYGLKTRLISIDPQPRNEIDALCDQVIRRPLETCRVEMFDALEPGDIFFLDSSHRSFQNSDVTVFFLEILPRLKPGVIVHIHDIYLPYDYTAGNVPRLWNEQYLLATALLFGAPRFEILFPSWFIGRDPDLRVHAEAMLRQGPIAELDLFGASFWMRLT